MSIDVAEMTALAARAKTRIKQRGRQGLSEVSENEIMALAFIADVYLEDYTGPMTRGADDYEPHPCNKELEIL